MEDALYSVLNNVFPQFIDIVIENKSAEVVVALPICRRPDQQMDFVLARQRLKQMLPDKASGSSN